jgi:hypothetical protein
MSGINKFIEWLEQDNNKNLSIEFIKLQAQIFAIEEKFSLKQFETVTSILNQKINQDGKFN